MKNQYNLNINVIQLSKYTNKAGSFRAFRLKIVLLTEISISNYKCHTNTLVTLSSNFHTIIGANSSGKTSIIESLRFFKKIGGEINGQQLFHGNIKSGQKKEIDITVIIELSKEERDYFFQKYFFLSTELIEPDTDTHIAKKVKLSLKIIPKNNNNSKVLISNFSISGVYDNNQFFTILKLSSDYKNFIIADFSPGIKGAINNNPSVNKHLQNLNTREIGLSDLSVSSFQGEFIDKFKNTLRFIPSYRNSVKEVNSKKYDNIIKIEEDGKDLLSAMLFMSNNQKERFYSIVDVCKRLFNDITDIHPYTISDNVFTIAIKKRNIDQEIFLNQEGSGIDQLFIIIWMIATSEPREIWFLDEPELHLHPGAQKLLYDFLLEKSNERQLIITTHSMVFIYKSKVNNISILLDHQKEIHSFLFSNLIEAYPNITEGIAEDKKYLYLGLGYDPTFSLEPKTIILVEGITDEKILKNFANTLGYEIDPKLIHFYPVGDKNNVKNFSPVLAFALSNKKCLILIDNDKKTPAEIIESY